MDTKIRRKDRVFFKQPMLGDRDTGSEVGPASLSHTAHPLMVFFFLSWLRVRFFLPS